MWIDDVPEGAVDATTGSPLHAQLSALLRAGIGDGSLPPGSQLPTEAEIQEKFGISRSVVRQTMAGLASDGLILRGRGRGSVVAPHLEHHRQVQRMPGLSAQISTVSGPVRTEVLTIAPGADARAAAALGTTRLLSLRRRRSADGEAIAIIHTWLPLSLAESLTAEELTDASLHALLAERFGVPVSAGRRQIRAVAASGQLAEELSVPIGSPLLLLEGTSLDDGGAPVEYFSTWHRADRVVFDVDVTAAEPQPNAALAGRVEELARELQALSSQLTRGAR
ncbi:GntR family transcriptional regulator [Homoserinimonas aerilata]|uniref:GntR family transcriptional regulator n=1 Tax=Homoserinimonas aerilata TaxID=1162970 RepID=A0A542XXF8_9MICO|nr:GntR family transcriptional regulator [Homoserinimonas aerilata]TQL40413.1 GntR family transcriptional regulator [Homoserinimonas aerilata]